MIYICADDYGLSESSDQCIKECMQNGALNKISIFPNGISEKPHLSHTGEDVYYSLHINLVEGKSLAPAKQVNLIADKNGYFKYSFGGLLKLSLSGNRKEFERQLYAELKEQIGMWKKCFGENEPIMLDSHQHTHMIPLIFKTLVRVIKDEGVNVRYLRIPAEPFLPYLKEPSLYFTYKPVNIIKQWVLKFFNSLNKKEKLKLNLPDVYFMGVLFSGNMDKKRVEKVLWHYKKLADKKNRDIEVLFHPGVIEEKDSLYAGEKCFKEFYFSAGRKTEYDAVKSLNLK